MAKFYQWNVSILFPTIVGYLLIRAFWYNRDVLEKSDGRK